MRYRLSIFLLTLAIGFGAYVLPATPTLAQSRIGANDQRNVIIYKDPQGVIYRDGPNGELINDKTSQVFTGGARRDLINGGTLTEQKGQNRAETPQERQAREKRVKEGGICDNVLSLTNFSSGGGGWGACLSGIIYIFSVGLASPFAYVGAYLLEYMLGFALNGTTYASVVVSTGWEVVRDLSNMAFIFILVYISFSVILGAENRQTRILLANVIIAALLINFSFFLTRLTIDASNLLALQIYSAIEVRDDAARIESSKKQSPVSVFGMSVSYQKPVTNTIMAGIGIQELIAGDTFNKWVQGNNFFTTLITLGFIFIAMGAMLAILAYAFLAAAIKLVVRVVTLWFTVILAPLAVVLWVLPKTRTFTTRWWNYHLNALLFPVGFLFVFYILTLFMGPLGASGGLFQDIFTKGGNLGFIEGIALDVASVAIRVIFVIALLIMAVKAGDTFSVYGADKINKWAYGQTVDRIERWGKRGGGVALMPARAAGRTVAEFGRRKVAGYAGRLETAAGLQSLYKFPVGGRQLRRGLQNTRLQYEKAVKKSEGKLTDYRTAEIDRRIRGGATAHDFLALVRDKFRRNDSDEVTAKEVLKAKAIAASGGIGTRMFWANRPDAAGKESDWNKIWGKNIAELSALPENSEEKKAWNNIQQEILNNMARLKGQDVGNLHRERITSLIDGDGNYKGGSRATAEAFQEATLRAMFEGLDGESLKTLFRRGGQNTDELFTYAARRLGATGKTDPLLFDKMSAELARVNEGRLALINQEMEVALQAIRDQSHREPTEAEERQIKAEAEEKRKGIEGLLSRTESAATYLKTTGAARDAGIRTQRDGGGGTPPGGGPAAGPQGPQGGGAGPGGTPGGSGPQGAQTGPTPLAGGGNKPRVSVTTDAAPVALRQTIAEELAELKKISENLKLGFETIREGGQLTEQNIREMRAALEESQRQTREEVRDLDQKLRSAREEEQRAQRLEEKNEAKQRAETLEEQKRAAEQQAGQLRRAFQHLDNIGGQHTGGGVPPGGGPAAGPQETPQEGGQGPGGAPKSEGTS